MYQDLVSKRLRAIYILFLIVFIGITVRLTYVQCINSAYYSQKASRQRKTFITLNPDRGFIFDRNMRHLALNIKSKSLYANPKMIGQKEDFAKEMAKLLDLDPDDVYRRVNRDKYFIWIKRLLTEQEYAKVKDLPVRGIGFLDEMRRFYPGENTASHVIGYTNIDNTGLEGLEYAFEKYLKGQKGWLDITVDAKRRQIEARGSKFMPPVPGHSLILTIDETIQEIVREALDAAVTKHNALAGTAIVMDPHTGEVLAMCNVPDYNLNRAHAAPALLKRNEAVVKVFEPGSTFKVITAAAVLDKKGLDLNDVLFCENGEYRVRGRILHDHKPHGNLSFEDVIVKSSNIGISKAAQKIGEKNLYQYIKAFGFGELTEIDLPGEASGIFRPLSRWSKSSIYAIPMGQEIAVTAIQMATAVSAIANGGLKVQPRITSGVIDSKSVIIKKTETKKPKRIISKETARKVRKAMRTTVDRGTGRHAKLKNYSAGGKTGTAQKVENGTYSHSKFTASFVGFAPVDNPAIVMYVAVDEPRPVYYGGLVAGPVFKNCAEKILHYLNVPEDIDAA